jgi:hypothetical protein
MDGITAIAMYLQSVMCYFHIAEKCVTFSTRVPRVICNLGSTSVENFTHAWCRGTTSVEKPLPTFQLYGSNIFP